MLTCIDYTMVHPKKKLPMTGFIKGGGGDITMVHCLLLLHLEIQ